MDTFASPLLRKFWKTALPVFLFFAAIFHSAPLRAAIAFDSASSVAVINATTTSWSHTVGAGSNLILLVGLSTEDTSSTTLNVSSVTYNGIALTAVANSTATDGTSTLDRSQLFYLLNPPVGTADVAVTFGGDVNGIAAGSISLSGAAQSAPSITATNISDSANALTTSVNVTTAGSWLLDAVCSGASNATFTATDAAMIKRWGTSESNSGGAGATKIATVAGATSMSWSASSSGRMAHSVTVIAPAPVGEAPTIVTQPTNQSVQVTNTATFSVVASGTGPLSYQWKFNNVAISGATSATLTLNNVTSANAGNYTVTVSNSGGSVTSNIATLTVRVNANPPVIRTQPVSQTVTAGANATFTVGAVGTAPLVYQWKLNGTALSGTNSSTLTITNAQPSNAGDYTVSVTNVAGTAAGNPATLTVNLPATGPSITTPPASQTVAAGGTASFSVVATGTGPLSYQWNFNAAPIPGATGAALTLNNLQPSNAGNYTVTVTNVVNSVTSSIAVLTVTSGGGGSASLYNLTGFATVGSGTTGGGVILETDPAYVKVTTPLEFANAIVLSNKTAGAVKVIEIMNDLNLGWNEIGSAVQTLSSTPFRAHATPKLHPTLIASGVSILDIKAKSGLTIFSANGATIKHVNFNLKGTSNIIIRNLKFDEMWEWDEATKGNYDSNDWDFLTLSNGGSATNVWVDHCTFTKAYDGILDQKAGTQYVTVSWCKYVGDDGATNPNSHVRVQVAALEANRASYTFYNFLRTNGYSVEDIVAIIQGHDKTHLMGSNSLDSGNATLSATFHHLWMNNLWDRCVPRLRAGNVHDYNLYVDDSVLLAAKRLRDLRAAAMTTSLRNTLNNTYSFNPPMNGSISTEGGAVLVEKSVYFDCLWPLRNNQTDPTDPTYTGKIQALDTIYSFDNTDGTNTTIRGNSTDAGNPMGPFQAPIIAFSWSGFAALPYAYTPDDPSTLLPLLQTGAGAGALTWDKSNWLKTSY